MNVVAIKTERTRKPRAQVERSRHWRKALKRQTLAAVGIGFVAVTLTALSLSHLAQGVEMVTHSATWSAWAMAVGIDLGFIGMECASIVAMGDKVKRQVERFAKPAIAGTLAGSAIMNAVAFASAADGLGMQVAASAMGVAIPALIYALTRIGASLYIDTHNKH